MQGLGKRDAKTKYMDRHTSRATIDVMMKGILYLDFNVCVRGREVEREAERTNLSGQMKVPGRSPLAFVFQ